ncbi:hypothetical protein, partial [Agarivorans sp. 1_MG-2023]|uniref:hypothetical protein n=1 Tax=Agarivorans sp. 1_MG-2023 TaxID=3062634 RepID=UPI0026E258F6
ALPTLTSFQPCFAAPLAVSVESHYREPRWRCKRLLQKNENNCLYEHYLHQALIKHTYHAHI